MTRATTSCLFYHIFLCLIDYRSIAAHCIKLTNTTSNWQGATISTTKKNTLGKLKVPYLYLIRSPLFTWLSDMFAVLAPNSQMTKVLLFLLLFRAGTSCLQEDSPNDVDYSSSNMGTLHVVQTSSLYRILRVSGVGWTRVSVRLSSTFRFKLFLKFHILKLSLPEWFSKFVVSQSSCSACSGAGFCVPGGCYPLSCCWFSCVDPGRR